MIARARNCQAHFACLPCVQERRQAEEAEAAAKAEAHRRQVESLKVLPPCPTALSLSGLC